MAQHELRPLRVTEIFDVSIDLYRRNAPLLLKMTALLWLPAGVLTLVITNQLIPPSGFIQNGQLRGFTRAELQIFEAGRLLLTAVWPVIGWLVALPCCIKACGDAYLGDAASAGKSWKTALLRIHSLIWIMLLIGLAVSVLWFGAGFALSAGGGTVAGTIVFLFLATVPVGYLLVSWSVAIPALLAENVRGARALARSAELVRGRWWPTFGLMIIALFIVPVTLTLAIGTAGSIIILQDDPSVFAFLMVDTWSDFLIYVVTTPLIAALLLVTYVDTRVRREGLDLELLAQRLPQPEDLDEVDGTALPRT